MRKSVGDGKITTVQPVKGKGGYHHGDLRQQLVNAAREIISENGMDRFSISAACKAAGVSTAAPYRHFSDKDDLLIDVKIDAMRRKAALMEERAAQHPRGTHESIAAIGEAYVDFAIEDPNMFRMVFSGMNEHPRKPELAVEGQATYGVLLGEVARFLGRDGIDDKVMMAAFPLWTFVHGLSALIIDHMLEKLDIDIDIPGQIDDATIRLLGPKPDFDIIPDVAPGNCG